MVLNNCSDRGKERIISGYLISLLHALSDQSRRLMQSQPGTDRGPTDNAFHIALVLPDWQLRVVVGEHESNRLFEGAVRRDPNWFLVRRRELADSIRRIQDPSANHGRRRRLIDNARAF